MSTDTFECCAKSTEFCFNNLELNYKGIQFITTIKSNWILPVHYYIWIDKYIYFKNVFVIGGSNIFFCFWETIFFIEIINSNTSFFFANIVCTVFLFIGKKQARYVFFNEMCVPKVIHLNSSIFSTGSWIQWIFFVMEITNSSKLQRHINIPLPMQLRFNCKISTPKIVKSQLCVAHPNRHFLP